jgi:uncharacterized heparinase superfamily protein
MLERKMMTPIIDGLQVGSFPDAGYDVMHRSDGLFVLFDRGILGMPPLFNHGHADALSFLVYKNGLPFIVDTGTYRYNHVPEWRTYFKGTSAHNTVTVNGQDQALQVTGFIWKDSYSVDYHREDNEKGVIIGGRHTGYAHGKNLVYHARTVQADTLGPVIVRDSFQGKATYSFDFRLHLHPSVRLQEQGHWLILSHGEERIALAFAGGELKQMKGSVEPRAGWFSKGYGHMEETVTLSAKRHGKPGDVSFTLVILSEIPESLPDPKSFVEELA